MIFSRSFKDKDRKRDGPNVFVEWKRFYQQSKNEKDFGEMKKEYTVEWLKEQEGDEHLSMLKSIRTIDENNDTIDSYKVYEGRDNIGICMIELDKYEEMINEEGFDHFEYQSEIGDDCYSCEIEPVYADDYYVYFNEI